MTKPHSAILQTRYYSFSLPSLRLMSTNVESFLRLSHVSTVDVPLTKSFRVETPTTFWTYIPRSSSPPCKHTGAIDVLALHSIPHNWTLNIESKTDPVGSMMMVLSFLCQSGICSEGICLLLTFTQRWVGLTMTTMPLTSRADTSYRIPCFRNGPCP